jgi:hypothetical protein
MIHKERISKLPLLPLPWKLLKTVRLQEEERSVRFNKNPNNNAI